ncbi:hypothetical protein BASA82_000411 [Batrachochytrium salamandrivorans]|nr:hypothetical protein BASA82_000411 [Batrachochytrium salamandrivorans]
MAPALFSNLLLLLEEGREEEATSRASFKAIAAGRTACCSSPRVGILAASSKGYALSWRLGANLSLTKLWEMAQYFVAQGGVEALLHASRWCERCNDKSFNPQAEKSFPTPARLTHNPHTHASCPIRTRTGERSATPIATLPGQRPPCWSPKPIPIPTEHLAITPTAAATMGGLPPLILFRFWTPPFNPLL